RWASAGRPGGAGAGPEPPAGRRRRRGGGRGVMVRRIDCAAINRGALFFWAAWLSAVVATNVLDGLRALGAPGAFPFASGNWGWINQVMDPLGVPRPLQAALFAAAVAWEALAAGLFQRAGAAYRGRPLA